MERQRLQGEFSPRVLLVGLQSVKCFRRFARDRFIIGHVIIHERQRSVQRPVKSVTTTKQGIFFNLSITK